MKRSIEGEIPVLRWLRARDGRKGFAVVSDVLANYDLEGGDLRVTLARATRYARAENLDASKSWWRPTTDRGELRERLTLLPLSAPVEDAAELLSQPPLITMAWENRAGTLPASGSLAALTPSDVQLLALKPGPDGRGLELRVKNYADQPRCPLLRLGRKTIRLGSVQPGEIATFRLGGTSSRRIMLGK